MKWPSLASISAARMRNLRPEKNRLVSVRDDYDSENEGIRLGFSGLTGVRKRRRLRLQKELAVWRYDGRKAIESESHFDEVKGIERGNKLGGERQKVSTLYLIDKIDKETAELEGSRKFQKIKILSRSIDRGHMAPANQFGRGSESSLKNVIVVASVLENLKLFILDFSY